MSAKSKQAQDGWTQGMSSIMEATRQNMTASRLATAGAVALGAAATAYLWDDGRRNRLMESGQRFSEDLMGWWSGLSPASPDAETKSAP